MHIKVLWSGHLMCKRDSVVVLAGAAVRQTHLHTRLALASMKGTFSMHCTGNIYSEITVDTGHM